MSMEGHGEMRSDKVLEDLVVSDGDCLRKLLEITSKGKLKWLGDFKSFQQFVEDVMEIKSKWSSPGGECKLIETDDVSIRWYPSKQTFTVGGLKGKEIKARLSSLLYSSLDSKDNLEDREDSEQLIDQAIFEEQYRPLPVPCITNDRLTTLEYSIEEIKSQMNNIKEELKHHCSHFNKTPESTSTPANHDNDQKSCVTNDLVQQCLTMLQRENSQLKKENEALRDRINTVSYVVADLNTKIKDVESEKSSLLAAIKLIYEDYRKVCENIEPSHKLTSNYAAGELQKKGINELNPEEDQVEIWHTVHQPTGRCKTNSIIAPTVEVINRYEVLSELSQDVDETPQNIQPTNGKRDLKQKQKQIRTNNSTTNSAKHTDGQPRAEEEQKNHRQGSLNQRQNLPRQRRSVTIVGDSMLKYLSPM